MLREPARRTGGQFLWEMLKVNPLLRKRTFRVEDHQEKPVFVPLNALIYGAAGSTLWLFHRGRSQRSRNIER